MTDNYETPEGLRTLVERCRKARQLDSEIVQLDSWIDELSRPHTGDLLHDILCSYVFDKETEALKAVAFDRVKARRIEAENELTELLKD